MHLTTTQKYTNSLNAQRVNRYYSKKEKIEYLYKITVIEGFPGGLNSKESACNVGHLGLILGSGRAPGKGNGNPLQYSCLENPVVRGAWWATVQWVTKSQTRLSN